MDDVDTAPAELIVTVTSSNSDLIDEDRIQVPGSGRTRMIQLTPEENAVGVVMMTVTVSDGMAERQETFQITVTPVNDAPEIAGPEIRSFELPEADEFVSEAPGLLAGVSDVDSESLQVIASQPENGSLQVNADGSFVYQPVQGFSGIDTFTYTVSDGTAESLPRVVQLSVPKVAAPPTERQVPEVTSSDSSDTVNESDSESSSTTTADTNETTDNSDVVDSESSVPMSPSSIEQSHSEDEEQGYVPPQVIAAAEEESDAVFIAAQTSVSQDGFLIQGEGDISISASERIHAAALRSMEQLTIGSQTHQTPTQTVTSQAHIPLSHSSFEAYAELKGTVEQLDEFEEQLESSSAVVEIAESVVMVGGTSIVIGSVISAVQSGMLALGFISQLPAWTLFDPLMVMDGVNGAEDGDSIQDIVDRQDTLEPQSPPTAPKK